MKYRIIDKGKYYKIQIKKGFLFKKWEDLMYEVNITNTIFPDWFQGKVFAPFETDDFGVLMDKVMDLESEGDQ